MTKSTADLINAPALHFLELFNEQVNKGYPREGAFICHVESDWLGGMTFDVYGLIHRAFYTPIDEPDEPAHVEITRILCNGYNVMDALSEINIERVQREANEAVFGE